MPAMPQNDGVHVFAWGPHKRVSLTLSQSSKYLSVMASPKKKKKTLRLGFAIQRFDFMIKPASSLKHARLQFAFEVPMQQDSDWNYPLLLSL